MAGSDYIHVAPKPNTNVVDLIYPIGSLYFSVKNTDPSTLFGGTWVAFGTGRLIAGVNANDSNFNTVEKTGGALIHTHTGPSHTHTINSHTHTMAHTHTGPSHYHTINSHTHTMAHTHTGPSHTHSGPSHSHSVSGYAEIDITAGGGLYISRNGGVHNWTGMYGRGLSGVVSNQSGSRSNAGVYGTAAAAGTGATGSAGNGTTSGSSASSTGGSGTLTSNSSGAGNTGGSSAANTGGSGTLTSNSSGAGNTGSASSLPPYITCYIWKRTA